MPMRCIATTAMIQHWCVRWAINQLPPQHTHTHTQQVGWVLRIDKGHTFMPEPGPLLDAMRALEHELWAPYPPISDAPDGTHRLPSTLPTHHLHTQPCIDGRRM